MISRWQMFWKNAFAYDDGRAEVTEAELALIEKIAAFLVRRKLQSVATMTLATMKPLNFVGSSLMTFFRPTIGAFLKPAEYQQLETFLTKRCSVDLIIKAIESAEEKQKREQEQQKK